MKFISLGSTFMAGFMACAGILRMCIPADTVSGAPQWVGAVFIVVACMFLAVGVTRPE